MGAGKAVNRRYRVVQWATGNIGSRSLRAVIEHPRLDLVGLYVNSPEKVGRDAGELCGCGPVGVAGVSRLDQIVDLKPDCVLYMQQGVDWDQLCELLASGANVVTTRGEFHNPNRLDPARRAQIEAACRKGNSSIHSTGSSPGFITEAMPLVLTSIQRRLDLLTIDEFADCSSRNSPDMLFRIMGFGQAPAAFTEARLAHIRDDFGPSLEMVANALGLQPDSMEVTGEVAVAKQQLEIAAGAIEAGTVAAQRITVTNYRGGKPITRFRANWYVSTQVEPGWDLAETGWRVLVEGDTPLDVRIRFPVAAENWAAFTPGLTAHRPVNAIPYVCEAAPGIRTTVELPQIIADLGP